MTKFYASTSPEIEQREIDHAALSRELAGECMVLLENDGALPLTECKKIALYGSGVRNTVKGGTGSGDVNTRENINIEEGFEHAGFQVTSKGWLDRQDALIEKSKKEYARWAEKTAEERGINTFVVQFDTPYKEPAPALISEQDCRDSDTDCAVYVISRNSGEGADRYCKEGDYLLYPEEKSNIEKISGCYKKTIIVLNVGGVTDLTELKEIPGWNALLLMNQLGNIGGDALADVISGKVTPSGKTTDTWAMNYMDYPSSEKFSHNDSVDDEYYTDGVYVGYRYFDTFGVEPLYCFGFGRSYTEFEVQTKKAEADREQVRLEVSVKNTGAVYAGKEVVQVYYSAPETGIDKPYKELAGFAKTALLKPGEEELLTITFPIKAMASYYEQEASWILEPGFYVLHVGTSSENTVPAAAITLDGRVIVRTGKNLFALDCEMEEIRPEEKKSVEVPEDILRVEIKAADIETEYVQYQNGRKAFTTDKSEVLTLQDVMEGKCSLEEMVAQLTVEEMAELCVGTLRAGEGSIVGNASATVPGAAGDTSQILKESRGVKGMIFADGPAGLRLQPHFKTTKAGEMIPGGDILGDTYVPFPDDLNEEDVVDYYQYCTAIPIGWALAQSWNEELVEKAGDMVGCEMEQFHVDLWLAPAMNIHRNPLCGRNFEYYSEDPLVAGKIAAAMTKGVQKHPGKGTTIKHFAVNNQEDNRYFVNAHVSERALREIYLKGFEIAVKESQPFSIMTSYNLLNGIHTANSHDLLQGMARDEWGFEGTVMTDWFTSQEVPELTGKFTPKYPISASTGCIYAGNDIQMPGCSKNVEDIVKAVTTGEETDGYKLTLGDLQYNAANILRIIMKTSSL